MTTAVIASPNAWRGGLRELHSPILRAGGAGPQPSSEGHRQYEGVLAVQVRALVRTWAKGPEVAAIKNSEEHGVLPPRALPPMDVVLPPHRTALPTYGLGKRNKRRIASRGWVPWDRTIILFLYLILEENVAEALKVLAANDGRFSKGANAYDNLAEAYLKVGKKAEAIANLKKSLKLGPQNTNAVKMLEKLGVELCRPLRTRSTSPILTESMVALPALLGGFSNSGRIQLGPGNAAKHWRPRQAAR